MEMDIPPPVPECTFSGENSGMKFYSLKKDLLMSYEPKIKMITIGAENNLDTKTLMLLGATGAGKTCLINALVNHIFGVRFEDNFRYVLKDETGDGEKKLAESQTEYVVGYLIFSPPETNRNYNYLIVDTPGFKDSKGQERDIEVVHQLKSFLQDVDGFDDLHCIGFVVNGTIARLQDQFSDIIDTFCEIFGENAKDIIRIMITFSHMRAPPVLNVLECSCLKDYRRFMFDNTALKEANKPNEENSEDDVDMYKIYWKKTSAVYNSILNEVDNSNAVSLTVTREALEHINHLNEKLDKMKVLTDSYLDHMIEFKGCEDQCSDYRTIMEANKNWEGTVDVKIRDRVKHYDWVGRLRLHAHICEKCMVTCKARCDHLLKNKCPRSGEICGNCGCPNENHSKSRDEISHHFEKRPVIHEDKKAAYEDAAKKEELLQVDMLDLTEKANLNKSLIKEEVSDIICQVAKISSVSLRNNQQSPMSYIETTLNLVKMEKIEKSGELEDHLGHIIPILDELREQILQN